MSNVLFRNLRYIIHICILLDDDEQTNSLRVSDAAAASIFHDLRVLEQRSLSDLQRRRLPRSATLLELLRRDVELNGVLHGVDRDDISVPHECNGTAHLRFGYNVPDAETMAPR